jgi:hypothetical protein
MVSFVVDAGQSGAIENRNWREQVAIGDSAPVRGDLI